MLPENSVSRPAIRSVMGWRMSDKSKDDDGAGPEPWVPSTDANSERPDPAQGRERPERKPKAARSRSADGDAPLRRRKAPEAEPDAAAGPATEAAPETAPEAETVFEGERIAKAIARAGIASRRDAETMILAGRVTLNGQVLDSPAVNVTDSDRITVDGEPLPARERTRLWLFHKPRGLVTTARDPEGRATVFDALPDDLPRVVAVGRLDINTEGLLLLTNDGGLAKVIAHPDTGWLRRYRVRAHGDTDQAQLDRLRKGVTIDGMEYGPIEATLDRVQGDNLWLTLGLREGKNREVKRILEHLGLSVNRLIRLSFGPFQLGELESGLVDEVRTKVLKEQLGKNLAEQAGVDFESPVREPIAPFGSSAKKAKPAAREESRHDAEEAPRSVRGRREAPAREGYERPARAKAPERVPTGGMGPGPRRSVWRADEASEAPRGRKVPRRGADPRSERETAAERGRERVGAIKSGERRVLVERLSPSPAPEAAPEEAPKRRRYARDEAPRPAARGRRGEGEAVREARGPRPERSTERGSERPNRRPPWEDEGAPRGRPARSAERPSGEGRGERRFGGKPDGRAGGKFEGRPGSGKPGGGKPGGAKRDFQGGEGRREGGPARAEGRPGGFKAGGPKPGGRSGPRGDAPKGAGFRGGKPGGGRPGGSGAGRPGGGAR
ncbi:pseudouridine synthase, partial [Methylobacterium dankookense]